MYSVETLIEIIGDKKLIIDIQFNHNSLIDTDYAKLFTMAVSTGIIKINAKIEDINKKQMMSPLTAPAPKLDGFVVEDISKIKNDKPEDHNINMHRALTGQSK